MTCFQVLLIVLGGMVVADRHCQQMEYEFDVVVVGHIVAAATVVGVVGAVVVAAVAAVVAAND